MVDQYLTANELAALLKINVDKIYALAASGEIPATRIGNQWRFDRDEIHSWFRRDRETTAID